MVERVYNFSPGPAVLPLPVLEQAQRDLVSLARRRHVGPGNQPPLARLSKASWPKPRPCSRELLGIPAGYKILFLQGGSSLQFSMLPMNLLRGTGKTADYVAHRHLGRQGPARSPARRRSRTSPGTARPTSTIALPAAAELKLGPDAGLRSLHVERNDSRRRVPEPTPASATLPLVCDASSEFPVAADRRVEVRRDLRLRPKERRASRA